MDSQIYPNLLTPRKTAAILGVTEQTLSVWRCTKRYPIRYVKIGSKVFYKAKDIMDFINSRMHGKKPIAEEKGDII